MMISRALRGHQQQGVSLSSLYGRTSCTDRALRVRRSPVLVGGGECRLGVRGGVRGVEGWWGVLQQRPFSRTAIPFNTLPSSPPSSDPSLLELVKILRKETQAGIADCREALLESNKDIQKAKEWLLKKAKKVAIKKGNRSTYEGGVLATVVNGSAVILEMNCETDFAAKESNFTQVARDIACSLLQNPTNDLEKALSIPHSSPVVVGVNVTDVRQAIEALTGVLKENVKLRRIFTFPKTDLHNFSYVHSALDKQSPPIGRIGVILRLRFNPSNPSPSLPPSLSTFAKNLCIQIAANNPESIHPSNQSTSNDEEPALLKQEYLFDSSVTVEQELANLVNKIGGTVDLVEFLRWELSEGVERVEANLAADVAALLKESKSS